MLVATLPVSLTRGSKESLSSPDLVMAGRILCVYRHFIWIKHQTRKKKVSAENLSYHSDYLSCLSEAKVLQLIWMVPCPSSGCLTWVKLCYLLLVQIFLHLIFVLRKGRHYAVMSSAGGPSAQQGI